MVQVYCYSKCTTCKKALKWLDENKIEYTLIDPELPTFYIYVGATTPIIS